jgi:hypothetical protein
MEAIPTDTRETAKIDALNRGVTVPLKRRTARRRLIPRKIEMAFLLPIFSDRGVDEVESAYEVMGSE